MLGLTACGSTPTTGDQPATTTKPMEQAAVTKPPQISLQPAAGAKGVNPTAPVKITVGNGEINSVKLTSSTGAMITGKASPDGHSWSATQQLGYHHTYTWSGTATGLDGKPTPITGAFRTVEPDGTISAQLNTGDGATYGVAMPIVVNFSDPVPTEDRAAVQQALSVRTSIPTEGSWAWLSSSSVHWRPKQFWTAGTKVAVTAKIYGMSFGGGYYGSADISSHFTIGKNQQIKGNVKTHRLVLLADGKVVHDFPTSYGKDSVLWRNTRSGVHVVMSKSPTYLMSNPRAGYKNVFVRWAVRISNNGEFIHAYPPTTWAQGNVNVSHGCANLTTARAKTVYDWVQIGDPVDIEGSHVELSAADGDYYDWALGWSDWQSKSALPASS